MTDGSPDGQEQEPGRRQQRPLTSDERALLHKVTGMTGGEPGFAGPVAAAARTAIGDGTSPQERDLTAREREALGNAIRHVITEWDSPRLPFREPSPAWDLTGADIARLGLIWRAVDPPPADPATVIVNAADWAPPPGIPDGWVIANGPVPIRGPASARAWQGEHRNGPFYAAWPPGEDSAAAWNGNDAREVLITSNREIAAGAGRYLAACGLLPGDAGLTAAETARSLSAYWKDGIMDEEQAREAALAAILEDQREDENLAYDGGSSAPPRRELTGGERALLYRLMSRAAADPRWADVAAARRPQLRAVLGDGSRPQARDLTARERDDIGRMIRLLGKEHRLPGDQALSPWIRDLTAGDLARLELIENAITPRRGSPYLDGPLFVNAAAWAPPQPVPDDWAIGVAPVPISGTLTWRGDRTEHGEFYAADPGDDAYGGWLTECRDTHQVEIITDEDIAARCYAFLGRHGCAAPEDAGVTIADVARDLGYPLTPDGAENAAAAARALSVLRASRGNGDAAWFAVHGTASRDQLARNLRKSGWEFAPAGDIPSGGGLPPEATAMADLAVGSGWDLECIQADGKTTVTAARPDTGEYVSQVWNDRGHLIRPADLEKITASPRPSCIPAGGPARPESPGPAYPGLPGRTAAVPDHERARRDPEPGTGNARRRRGGAGRRGDAGPQRR